MPEMKQHGISVSSSPSPSKPEEHTPFPPFTLSPFVSHSIDPYNTTDDSHFSPHLNGSEDDGSLLLFGNGTNDTSKYVPYHQRPETYVVPVLFALIFIIGIIGKYYSCVKVSHEGISIVI